MKTIKITLLLLCLCGGFNRVSAQESDSKWSLSIGINSVDINNTASDIGAMVEDYFKGSDFNTLPAISQVTVERDFGSGLSLELTGSINKINDVPGADELGLSFFSLGTAAQYHLNALNFISNEGWLDAYVKLGAGYTWIEGKGSFTVNPGFGFNTWFNDIVGLNISSTFHTAAGISDGFSKANGNQFFQHSLGLKFRL
ncbi:MAG: hypothetical protein ACPHXR_05360 [Flavicella sp.]